MTTDNNRRLAACHRAITAVGRLSSIAHNSRIAVEAAITRYYTPKKLVARMHRVALRNLAIAASQPDLMHRRARHALSSTVDVNDAPCSVVVVRGA